MHYTRPIGAPHFQVSTPSFVGASVEAFLLFGPRMVQPCMRVSNFGRFANLCHEWRRMLACWVGSTGWGYIRPSLGRRPDQPEYCRCREGFLPPTFEITGDGGLLDAATTMGSGPWLLFKGALFGTVLAYGNIQRSLDPQTNNIRCWRWCYFFGGKINSRQALPLQKVIHHVQYGHYGVG